MEEAELDLILSQPDPETVAAVGRFEGPLIILGAGGKMGPSMARMARRAALAAGRPDLEVIAVSRFSDPAQANRLREWGVRVVVADLSDPQAVDSLPDASDVMFLAGRKFGVSGTEGATWVMNTVVPGNVARRFEKSRIVAFSTGCVYPLCERGEPGCTEDCPPQPVGEYAASCLGRERLFEHYSRESGTKVLLLRLNYAIALRYGVLTDLALQIHRGGLVETGVPEVNLIWQGDANNIALRALELAASPPAVLNVTGVETLAVEDLARQLAERMGRVVEIQPPGTTRGYVADAAHCARLMGPPRVSTSRMLDWTAQWVGSGMPTLGKPTRFEVTDGKFLG
ncbi:MAG: hypothetical protein PWP23_1518 [Candidatus Sumerlaeota bacterium]|nr:hypothetical protein [Candidatus Sumerlaeota bacterium]